MTSILISSVRAASRRGRLRLSSGVIAGMAALTAARLLAAATIPLTEDEAYYRLWAQHLNFGYFDHPPMVACWIAIGRSLVGDSTLGARLLSIFATTAASLLIIDIGRTLGFSERASERAGVWYNAMFLIGLGGAVITPDAPATFFWTATLWALAKAWRSGAGMWWLLAGFSAGMAALSKYSSLFIGPGVLLWLASSSEGRAELRRPWPWLALVIAAVVFSPNIIWNASHHWLSFTKQFSRIAPSRFTPFHILDFPATQFFLMNPLIAIFAIRGSISRRRSGDFHATGLLLLTILPFSAYLMAHSLHAGVQAHWPAPLYPAVALLAAQAADFLDGPIWRRMAAAVPWVGFVLSAAVLVHMALPQTDWLGVKDPVAPLRGWGAFSNEVEAMRLKAGADWVGTFSYGAAAELLNERRSAAPIVELIERGRYVFQGSTPALRGDGIVVELSRRLSKADLSPCFSTVRSLGSLQRGDGGRSGVVYNVFAVSGPKVDLIRQGCRVGKDPIGR